MKIISLGWGVQSFTMAAMAALGDLPPVDVAIHADTLHERQATYQFAAEMTPWLESHGVRVVTVKNPTGGIEKVLSKRGQTHIPLYTQRESDRSAGMLRRSCTQRWKIAPMRTWIQKNRSGQRVEQWIGISLDEALRMKQSDAKYISHRWPLIDARMTRNDCVEYLKNHALPVPPKSSCTFCPFHNSAAWRSMRDDGGDDWIEAVRVDLAVRCQRPGYQSYLTAQRVPLTEMDLRTQSDRGQMSLWDEECSGICGV